MKMLLQNGYNNMGKVNHKNNRGDIHKITDAVIHLYLIYMFVVFPLVLHDGYKDITITKYNFFKNGVLALLIIMALLLVLYLTDRSGNTGNPGNDRAASKKHTILASDVFMGLFLLAGFFAFIASKDRTAAFTGELGRRCGLAFLLLVGAVYICVAAGCSLREWIYLVFACTSGLTYLMSILQHLEIDLFHLYASIRFDQRTTFISTFGNINMFASFLCLTVPLFMAAAMYADKCWKRVLYTVVLFLGGMAVIAANSDVAYIGIGVPVIVLLLAGIRNRARTYDDRIVSEQNSGCDPFSGWLTGCTGIILGYTVMAFLTTGTGKGYDKLTGFAKLVDHRLILTVVSIVLVIGSLIYGWYSKKKTGHTVAQKKVSKSVSYKKHTTDCWKIIFWIVIGILILTVFVTVVTGVSNQWEIFTFDDEWGNYRGYVWSRLTRIYQDLPFVNKVFGAGNESIYTLMSARYSDEMIEVTGTVYDSAHNEYLQYLVTMGIAGLITYLGLIISSIVNGVKMVKEDPLCIPLLAGMIGYVVQAFVNVEQPITTPFLFLFLALMAGMRRRSLKAM